MTLVEWHQEKGMQLRFDLIQGRRKFKKGTFIWASKKRETFLKKKTQPPR